MASYLDVVKKAPGIVDFWQLHKSLVTDDAHNTSERFIANIEPEDQCQGHWLKATVEPDGKYTISNSRNRFSKSYRAK